MNTRFILSMAGALLAIGMQASTATAATKTANMHTSAKLLAVSASISVSPLNFGTLVIPASGSRVYNGQATITVNVTDKVAFYLTRSRGNYFLLHSRMKDTVSGKFISYKLYKNANHYLQWPYAVIPTSNSKRTIVGMGFPMPIYIYASATVQSTDVAGTYNDINTIKLVY